jgi:arylsulfatase
MTANRRAAGALRRALLASCAALALRAPAAAAQGLDRTVLPIPQPPFAGQIGPTPAQSTPSWTAPVSAPAGAPNVLLVMTDDVGFGAASTFGGPVPTSNLDRLAARGLRYNNFHTTAICSASRAALLTGRNHHRVGYANLADIAEGYPGYDNHIPRSAATIARVLGGNGYSTAFFGKDHNVPREEASAAGPFDQWPTGLGFDYFYGFVGGDADQWQPRLFRGVTQVDDGAEKSGELLDKRLTDDALTWLHNQKAAAPDRPFFIYFAPGSTHAPHQAPPDWIARFHGKFDQGWDKLREETFARQKAMGLIPAETKLTPRPAQVPAWDTLSPKMKRVNARDMEVYAAQLAYEDAQFGRLIDELQRMGQLDNTLVIFIEGDNGASAEAGPQPMTNEIGRISNRLNETDAQLAAALPDVGGPKDYGNYSIGWSYALDTPFKWFKQVASHLGGMNNGMVLSWPAQIHEDGQMRTHFADLTDILPTILGAARVPMPARVDGADQMSLDGVSLAPTFADPNADNHHTQYFEIIGNQAIYHDGWIASTTPVYMPWDAKLLPPGADAPRQWELYDLRADFSQADDLAASRPDKLKAMLALWDEEARRNQVYPVDDRPLPFHADPKQMAASLRRADFVYWGKDVSVTQDAAPILAARSFSVTATIEVPPGGANGVLLADGSWFGGWSFFLKDGRPVAVEAASQLPGDQFRIAAAEPVPPGPAVVTYAFTSDGGLFSGGRMQISVNGEPVAAGRIGRTISQVSGLGETLDTGRDTGAPVTAETGRGEFTGTIDKVEVQLGPFGLKPGQPDPAKPVKPD